MRSFRLGFLLPLLTGLLTASAALAVSEDAPSAELSQPLPPIVLREFSEALSRPHRDAYPAIDRGLELSRQQVETGYAWLHCYLYFAGVHAAVVGDEVRACQLLDEYLVRTARATPTEPIPSCMANCPDFRAARNTVVRYRERLMKQWGDQRWCLHNYKSDQIGFEYESAISLRVLHTSGPGIDDFLDSLGVRAEGQDDGTCGNVTADCRALFCALRHRQTGNEEKAAVLLDHLAASNSRHPVPPALIGRLRNPPAMFLGLRPLPGIALLGLLLAGVASGRWFRRRRTRSSSSEDRLDPEYAVDRKDILSWLAVRWMGMSPAQTFLFGLVFIGGGIAVLAWSEGVLWPSGHVVSRSFLDYLSFPYGFGLLVPAFLAGTLLFYRLVQTKLPEVLDRCFPSDCGDSGSKNTEVRARWLRAARTCNSLGVTLGCATASVVITALQKAQWAGDPGTAFVDLHYPGHWSLTGLYYTATGLLVYYGVLSCVFRGIIILGFVAKVYSRKWRDPLGIQAHFDPSHPDNCSGTQSLGWIFLLFYVLLLLLAAQVLLNVVEKLRFYESIDVVLQHTFVSVIGFSGVFVLIVPILVGRPLVAIHMAMREYRLKERLRLAALADRHTDIMLKRIDEGTVGVAEVQAFSAMKSVEADAKKMPLWPFDLKVAFYFVASHVVPLISFMLPAILEWLGVSF